MSPRVEGEEKSGKIYLLHKGLPKGRAVLSFFQNRTNLSPYSAFVVSISSWSERRDLESGTDCLVDYLVGIWSLDSTF